LVALRSIVTSCRVIFVRFSPLQLRAATGTGRRRGHGRSRGGTGGRQIMSITGDLGQFETDSNAQDGRLEWRLPSTTRRA
jgi:hypothetical protein